MIRAATTGDLARVATSLADAFWDDPVAEFALPPDVRNRQKRIEVFMRTPAKAAVTKHGSAYTNDDVSAVAVWRPPGHWKVSPLEMLPAMPWMLYALRGRARVAMAMLTAIEAAHPTEPHWYLEILGTRRSDQGKGHGSAVLSPVLERCDAEGVPAYLESSKEQNIPFYERHGFRVTGEITPPHGAPTLWSMWRDPQAS